MDDIRDKYRTVGEHTLGDYREKGSKFLAYSYNVSDVTDVQLHLEEVRCLHPKARHFCYAYRLGIDGQEHRTNDDGEPSGTAGKPILGQMLSHDISDCLIVVVRYFGGTKLGASGLINAYKTAAKEALSLATIKDIILGQKYQLTFSYGEMGHVMNIIKSMNLNIIEKSFEVNPVVVINIRNSKIESTLIKLKALLLGISTEQIREETTVPFCDIKHIKK